MILSTALPLPLLAWLLLPRLLLRLLLPCLLCLLLLVLRPVPWAEQGSRCRLLLNRLPAQPQLQLAGQGSLRGIRGRVGVSSNRGEWRQGAIPRQPR